MKSQTQSRLFITLHTVPYNSFYYDFTAADSALLEFDSLALLFGFFGFLITPLGPGGKFILKKHKKNIYTKQQFLYKAKYNSDTQSKTKIV